MRKVAVFLLTLVLLSAMLTVFAVPVSASASDMVGQWVTIDDLVNPPEGFTSKFLHYYCYVVDDAAANESEGTGSAGENDGNINYTIAIYSYNIFTKEIMDVTSITGALKSSATPCSDIPEVVLEKAGRDYPNVSPAGSIFSKGSIWIIIAGAVAAVAVVTALVIVKKKKKPALAGGAENKGEE